MFGSGSGAFSNGAESKSGFGQTNTSLFNHTTQPHTGIFGTTAAAPAFGRTLAFGGTSFTASSGFEGTCAGGSTIKFKAVPGTDTMVRNGVNKTIYTMHQSITLMKEYETKIFEILRFEDYSANRKVGQQSDVQGGIFGVPKTVLSSTPTTSTGLFGANDNKPLFGATSTTLAFGGFNTGGTCWSSVFGTPTSTSASTGGLFGQQNASIGENTGGGLFSSSKPNTAFGQSKSVGTGFAFGTPVMQPTTNIFGEHQPSTADTRMFGTSTTGTFTFGVPKTVLSSTPTTSTGLFGANDNKPLFGATSTTLAFGGFNTGGTCWSSVFGTPTSTLASTGGLFGQQNASIGENTGGGLFSSSKPNTAFGQSKSVGTGFAFGTPVMQPTTNIFGEPQPSTADTRMFDASTTDSKEYLLEKVVDEHLINNLIRPVHPSSIPQVIRSKPKQSCGLPKVVLGLSWSYSENRCITNWYDPSKNLLQVAPEMFIQCDGAALCVVKDKFVVAVGGNSWNANATRSVEMLDVSSQSMCWIPKVKLLVGRKNVGVGVLDGCIYAVGGCEVEGSTINNTNHIISQFRENNYLNSAEVFNFGSQEWRMISSMFNKRSNFGVGVLNNLLYAVGGFNGSSCLKFVECYNPILDIWNPIAEMSVCRLGAGIGVLDGIMYAIGGTNASVTLKSVEAYSPNTGVWTSIADMNLCRQNPGVVVFDGLLYVMGGKNGSVYLNSLEIYDPNTNSWSMKTLSTSHLPIYGAVVVNRPPQLTFKK